MVINSIPPCLLLSSTDNRTIYAFTHFLQTCFSYKLVLNVIKLTVNPSNRETATTTYPRYKINRFLVVLFFISNKNQTRLLYILCINDDGLLIVFSFIELVDICCSRGPLRVAIFYTKYKEIVIDLIVITSCGSCAHPDISLAVKHAIYGDRVAKKVVSNIIVFIFFAWHLRRRRELFAFVFRVVLQYILVSIYDIKNYILRCV